MSIRKEVKGAAYWITIDNAKRKNAISNKVIHFKINGSINGSNSESLEVLLFILDVVWAMRSIRRRRWNGGNSAHRIHWWTHALRRIYYLVAGDGEYYSSGNDFNPKEAAGVWAAIIFINKQIFYHNFHCSDQSDPDYEAGYSRFMRRLIKHTKVGEYWIIIGNIGKIIVLC